MPKRASTLVMPVEAKIITLREERIILDTDLASLNGVPVKRLNQQVRRNRQRFPADFVFQLKPVEKKSLRLQIATAKSGRGGRRSLPYAFTEPGAIMAAAVLNSHKAVEMSIFVVPAFVRMREMLAGHNQIAAKIRELENHIENHDTVIRDLVVAIKQLMMPPRRQKRKIGFQLPPAA